MTMEHVDVMLYHGNERIGHTLLEPSLLPSVGEIVPLDGSYYKVREVVHECWNVSSSPGDTPISHPEIYIHVEGVEPPHERWGGLGSSDEEDEQTDDPLRGDLQTLFDLIEGESAKLAEDEYPTEETIIEISPYDEEKTAHLIQKLKGRGKAYSPQNDTIRPI